jgi:hypothetical protein
MMGMGGVGCGLKKEFPDSFFDQVEQGPDKMDEM